MDHKEKAKELIEKFLDEQSNTEDWGDARKCAIICVDEIIKDLSFTTKDISSVNKRFNELIVKGEYWQKVKQELQK